MLSCRYIAYGTIAIAIGMPKHAPATTRERARVASPRFSRTHRGGQHDRERHRDEERLGTREVRERNRGPGAHCAGGLHERTLDVAATTVHHSPVTMSRVYTASDPAPRFVSVVETTGASAAIHAVAMPALRPATRRASAASGMTSRAPQTIVSHTVPKWGSVKMRSSPPSRNGTNGGKCNSA